MKDIIKAETNGDNRLSTRQLLVKIPNYPGLYRHTVNQTYYGIKKIAGKRKEHSLDTADRKIAERRLKEWIETLDKIDAEAEKTTLDQLIEKFSKAVVDSLASGDRRPAHHLIKSHYTKRS